MGVLISTARAAFSTKLLPSTLISTIYLPCKVFCTPCEDPITSDNLTKSSALISEMLVSFKLHALVTPCGPEMSVTLKFLLVFFIVVSGCSTFSLDVLSI